MDENKYTYDNVNLDSNRGYGTYYPAYELIEKLLNILYVYYNGDFAEDVLNELNELKKHSYQPEMIENVINRMCHEQFRCPICFKELTVNKDSMLGYCGDCMFQEKSQSNK